jgi:hypothetical protein
MQQRDRAYQIVDNNLYKTSVLGPLLQCLSKAEGQEILLEAYAEICGGHIGARALAAKVCIQAIVFVCIEVWLLNSLHSASTKSLVSTSMTKMNSVSEEMQMVPIMSFVFSFYNRTKSMKISSNVNL